MRFPDIKIMTRVFNLFCYPPLNEGNDPLRKRMIPYYFTTKTKPDNGILYYNGVRERNVHGEFSGDPFKAAEVIQDVKPEDKPRYITAGVAAITEDAFKPFVTGLIDDLDKGTRTGWEHMMNFDKYSTRAYMATKYEPKIDIPPGPLSTDVINWCETFDKSSGWYDRLVNPSSLRKSLIPCFQSSHGERFGRNGIRCWCSHGGLVVLPVGLVAIDAGNVLIIIIFTPPAADPKFFPIRCKITSRNEIPKLLFSINRSSPSILMVIT